MSPLLAVLEDDESVLLSSFAGVPNGVAYGVAIETSSIGNKPYNISHGDLPIG